MTKPLNSYEITMTFIFYRKKNNLNIGGENLNPLACIFMALNVSS